MKKAFNFLKKRRRLKREALLDVEEEKEAEAVVSEPLYEAASQKAEISVRERIPFLWRELRDDTSCMCLCRSFAHPILRQCAISYRRCNGSSFPVI